MPICNEDVSRVSPVRDTQESVKATGNAAHFDIASLSDSYSGYLCVAEQRRGWAYRGGSAGRRPNFTVAAAAV